jgi:hypothetical protein
LQLLLLLMLLLHHVLREAVANALVCSHHLRHAATSMLRRAHMF